MRKDYSGYYGLIFNCPMNRQVDRCVFKSIRQLQPQDRMKYVNCLSMEEKEILIRKHQHCLAERENKVPFSRIAIM